jgi:Fe-S cluster assembly scaffold protein SufB
MIVNANLAGELIKKARLSEHALSDPETAHLFIHHKEVVSSRTLPGLEVHTKPFEEGIKVDLSLQEKVRIKKPVHLCFGMLPEKGIQKIFMDVNTAQDSEIHIYAHCVFPNAVDVHHIMDAEITIGKNSKYSYYERHVHGKEKGINVFPRAKIELSEDSEFKTEFELIEGRVGIIDIDYEVNCRARSILEMIARINGTGDDVIRIKETGNLLGKYSKGVLKSRVALRNSASAEIINNITASAPYARGHVDCKEIIQDNAYAKAVPVVDVKDSRAHVTHEAVIGSVDSKQLTTLMARGLDEDEATELIIKGLLK